MQLTPWEFTNNVTYFTYEYDAEGFDEALNMLAEECGDNYRPAEWELTDSY